MDSVSFRKALAVLRRQWWVVLQAMVIVGVAAGWQASRVPPEPYEASTSVLLRIDPNYSDGSIYVEASTYVQAQVRSLRGPAVQAAVSERLPKVPPEELTQIVGTSEEFSTTLTLTATNSDPERAIAIANTYAEVFVEVQNFARAESLNIRATEIEQQLTSSQARVSELTSQINIALFEQQDASALEAEKDAELRRYQGLFDQQQSVLTQIATQPKAAEQLDPAMGASQEPGPSVPMRAALGAILGLFIGAALAATRELLDDVIRTPEEAAEIAGAPTISRLPKAAKELRNSLPVVDDTERALAEAFRSLRTSVRFLGADEPLRAVAVSSPEQGDGKSLVSANLAAAFAMAGNKTVLVSGDLRRPKLDAALGVAGHLGLADLLTDQRQHLPTPDDAHDTTRFPIIRATDFLCETDVTNLWVLPAGTPTPNPAELLGSPSLHQIIDDLVKFSDLVVIDCPPTVVTDGVVLAKLVDGALLVTSMVKTHKSSLRVAIDRMRTARVNILGVIANRAVAEQGDTYGYGYYEQTRQA